MAVYAIGDIQGCLEPLQRLLQRLDFAPERDSLWLTGDLVNRGPESLAVLRFVRSLGERARFVLGNHDLHLLAVWCGDARLKPRDSLHQVLDAPDAPELMNWLRQQPLLYEQPGLDYVLVHAGVPPCWTLNEARARAAEVEAALRAPDPRPYFRALYGNEPALWSEDLRGMDRLRFITNAFTRMRYCDEQGRLLLDFKGPPEQRPQGYLPWFGVPGRRQRDGWPTVVCGHWSALGFHHDRGVIALDTGCLWGGELTALRLDGAHERYSVECEACLVPR